MEETAQHIVDVIGDYHNYRGFQFTTDHVIKWVKQFDEPDQQFILEEFYHILQKGCYISENKARSLLMNIVNELAKEHGFKTVTAFLENCEFLMLQDEGKSQDVLLKMLDEEIQKKGHPGIKFCGSKSKKYKVYIDDIIATGGSVFKHLLGWLQNKNEDDETNLEKVKSGEIKLSVGVFCLHTWAGWEWRLKESLKDNGILKKITTCYQHLIDNHPKSHNPKFNFAYPVNDNDPYVNDYINSLHEDAVRHDAFTYRNPQYPAEEKFYSSPENRKRFEKILLTKGIKILSQANHLEKNHRPLGCTFPSFKTFGTGTMFFTWRNISNTCPVVYWWKSANWQPLFPLYHRGLGKVIFGI